MNLWTMITVVSVAGIFAGVYSSYLKAKAESFKGNLQNNAHENKIKALEDRVQTLEKIVTDKSYDLKCQIDNL